MRFGRRIRRGAIVLTALGLSISPATHAQPAAAECDPYRLIHSRAEFTEPSDLPAMRAFLDLVPASCEQVRASISGDIAAIELIPEWRAVTSGGSIAAATAPPPPPWAANPEAWPSRITNAMLLQQPANEQIQRLHTVRAVERELRPCHRPGQIRDGHEQRERGPRRDDAR